MPYFYGMLLGFLIVLAALDGHRVALWLCIAGAAYAIVWVGRWLWCLINTPDGEQS